MNDFVRKHLTYANVVATVALLFAMAGGALATSRYLITSTRQISPRVLAELKANDRGKRGPEGKQGPEGETGTTGPEGKQGPEGKTGTTGPEGKQGPEGKTGTTGPEGKQGPEGKTGTTGPEGKPGPEGKEKKEGPETENEELEKARGGHPAPTAAQVAAGKTLFDDTCEACHGPSGDATEFAPSLHEEPRAQSIQGVMEQLISPIGAGMPNFRSFFSIREKELIADFVAVEITHVVEEAP